MPQPPYHAFSFRTDEGQHWIIVDDKYATIATVCNRPMADFLLSKLNNGLINKADFTISRPLIALELGDFRAKLERENGGAIDDPTIAFLMSDLCDHLKLNTGERAVVMGPALLAYLASLDTQPIRSTVPERCSPVVII